MITDTTGVTAVVLGGGRGQRLYPLTKYRSKPAVPMAGKFRLIDIPISNCLHAGISRIFILTQFNTLSIHRHLEGTYKFDIFTKGFIQILAAQQTLESSDWYQGTADAVRQNLHVISHRTEEDVLVLSGDHLYRMDFKDMTRRHKESGADITIAALPVSREKAKGFGILKADENSRIIQFVEKPTDEKLLDSLTASSEMFEKAGFKVNGETHIASMGIYLFKKEVLKEALSMTDAVDFGKEIIPQSLDKFKVNAYFFGGYWEDIGTIRSFYNANISLIVDVPEFNFYHESKPIYAKPRYLPGSKIGDCDVISSLLSDGSIIEHRVSIKDTIIGIRSIVKEGSKLDKTIMMGADYYDESVIDGVHLGIGKNCDIVGAIIDKNVRIGDDVTVASAIGKDDFENDLYTIRDGIVIIPKNAIIPSGTEI